MFPFPQGFVWGTATAAYQIEGAVAEDGRTPSIWDVFSAKPGNVRNGDTGAIACDHYHRVDEDLDLLADLGVDAYRFSVAWPRVIDDAGQVNRRGLDFYRRLVDGLHRRGVEPFLTLYHWDLPQSLEDRGGWTARDTALRYVDYAQVVHEALGDQVRHVTTLNEPWVSAWCGYGLGIHAPGHADPGMALAATHHLLLAHGLTAGRLREKDPSTRVGITLNLSPCEPATDTEADRAAARRVDGQLNRLYLDPLRRGSYPQDVLDLYREHTDYAFVRDGDLAAINAPLDFLGINYYRPNSVADRPESSDPLRADVRIPPGVPVTAMDWPVQPDALTDLLHRVSADYGPLPLYITENGAAYEDYADPDGRVQDPQRVDFLRGHLRAAHRAIEEGVDLRGYFLWSLLDNFEWSEGFAKRFGIVHVDYPTQRRTLKSSAHWYRDVIARGGPDV
ncbi:GH1 family beta-glucosidase [Micromonospora sp. BQ11]|uniref:GH1 family beta-glucosidase n=1 Tax=Micromonospora sp. BQ11 TaxID=3452212 RepID=UPI003F8A5F87